MKEPDLDDFDSMDEEGVFFHSESTDFSLEPAFENKLADWISTIAENHEKRVRLLNIIFCSDDYLYRINVDYLDHDNFTDIITFPYADSKDAEIEGDLFISIDRIRENADAFKVAFLEELCRVIIHGTLHLLGFGDKSPEEAKLMREKENESLQILADMN